MYIEWYLIINVNRSLKCSPIYEVSKCWYFMRCGLLSTSTNIGSTLVHRVKIGQRSCWMPLSCYVIFNFPLASGHSSVLTSRKNLWMSSPCLVLFSFFPASFYKLLVLDSIPTSSSCELDRSFCPYWMTVVLIRDFKMKINWPIGRYKRLTRLMEEFLLWHESNLLRPLTVSVLLSEPGLIKSLAVKNAGQSEI